MTKPARDANLRWPGLLLAAVVAVLVTVSGAGTASAATATAAQTRVGAHTLLAQILVEPHSRVGAGQRLGKDLQTYDCALATGVAAEAGGAYGTALNGGRHAGFLANYAGKPTAQIERGITSIEKQIAEHQAKIANAGRYIDDWASLDPRQQQALVNSKWPGDIARQQEQLDILRGILGSR